MLLAASLGIYGLAAIAFAALILLLLVIGRRGSKKNKHGFQYHIPPGAARDPARHWMYDKRKRKP